jgi:phosphatidylglycerol lysyltransferase
MKLGESGRVPLAAFSIDGAKKRRLRQAIGRSERLGIIFSVHPAADVGHLIPDLEAVSTEWLRSKRQNEKQFSLGRFDANYLRAGPVATVSEKGNIIAFANLWTLPGKNELSADLMRHLPDVPHGIMDFLLVKLMWWARDDGYRWFALGMAPLSGIENRRLAPLWARLAGVLYRHGERLYGYEGLRRYKEKFDPVWTPRYLAAPRGLGMARALIDVTLLISASPPRHDERRDRPRSPGTPPRGRD